MDDSDSDGISNDNEKHKPRGRKNIRTVKNVEELSTNTRLANLREDERIKRIQCIKDKFDAAFDNGELNDELILDYDFENDCPLVSVHKKLVVKLKTHQKEGIRFMWNACYESLNQIKNSYGSGCILAHCMGLGKSLQVVALVHTLLKHTETKTHTVLICCPKNTVMNWINEFSLWITHDIGAINVFNPSRYDDDESRLLELTRWQMCGGVCIMNYELYRLLLDDDKKSTKNFSLKLRKRFKENLHNPGPDLIVCDEGHVLKNEDTKLSRVMVQIRTLRRIVLTGTPMQNNLIEYHCMVHFVKPHLLGTRNEFLNGFVNPILNGQYENSMVDDVRLMKERSHILHKKLSGCVQRFDLTVLKKYLPDKYEYVIFIPLTDIQIDMYKHYLEYYSAKRDRNWKNRTALLFADYQALQRVWTHPYTLKLYQDDHDRMQQDQKNKMSKKKKRRDEEDENYDSSGSSDSECFRWCRYPSDWWVQFISPREVENTRQGNKLILLLSLLKEFEAACEKVLLFSGSLYSLRIIQHFLSEGSRGGPVSPSFSDVMSTWAEGEDYLILTGQTSAKDRDKYCKLFNDVYNGRLRLFLISTKAGGMGINLTAASRAILFDVSWNPSHDIQSIFRIYRIGQTKPCFVYRLVASGTMEEKIYERQIAKESISFRVVDEKQTARHFTENELLQLYSFEPKREHDSGVSEITDPILKKVRRNCSDSISGVLEHDSLLKHREEEELEENEKNNAWTAYLNNQEYNGLPDEIKAMLCKINKNCFDKVFFQVTLESIFPEASASEIISMMEKMMPVVNAFLEKSNFMAKKSSHNVDENHGRRKRKRLIDSETNQSVTIENKENNLNSFIQNSTPTSSSTPASKSNTPLDDWDSSDSDILYEVEIGNSKTIRKPKKRKTIRKPLKSWGAWHGKEYGSPDKQ